MPDDSRVLMDEHSAGCEECAKFSIAYKLVSDSLIKTGKVSAPAGLFDNIIAVTEKERKKAIIKNMYGFKLSDLGYPLLIALGTASLSLTIPYINLEPWKKVLYIGYSGFKIDLNQQNGSEIVYFTLALILFVFVIIGNLQSFSDFTPINVYRSNEKKPAS